MKCGTIIGVLVLRVTFHSPLQLRTSSSAVLAQGLILNQHINVSLNWRVLTQQRIFHCVAKCIRFDKLKISAEPSEIFSMNRHIYRLKVVIDFSQLHRE